MSYYDDYYDPEPPEEYYIEELKNISRESAQPYLGEYGDAIQERVDRCISEARKLNEIGHCSQAVVVATTAIELTIRFLLIRPLVQGAFLSDEWAAILAKRIAHGRSAEDRELLPAILRQWEIDLDAIELSDSSKLWPVITRTVMTKRNDIIHKGSTATAEDAAQSIECAETLLSKIVLVIAAQLGFTLERSGNWCVIISESGGRPYTLRKFNPKSPF